MKKVDCVSYSDDRVLRVRELRRVDMVEDYNYSVFVVLYRTVMIVCRACANCAVSTWMRITTTVCLSRTLRSTTIIFMTCLRNFSMIQSLVTSMCNVFLHLLVTNFSYIPEVD